MKKQSKPVTRRKAASFRICNPPRELAQAMKLAAARYPALRGGPGAPELRFSKNGDPAAPFSVEVAPDGSALVRYGRVREAMRAVGQLLSGSLPAAPESAPFDSFGIMWDVSRNAVPTTEYAQNVLLKLALLGYDTVLLYAEDVYEIPGEPYFGFDRGRLTAADVRALDARAAALGIRLVPCIQTLAHLDQIFRWDAYAGVRDLDGILLAWEDATYALVEKMVRFWASNCRSRVVHLGMDEAWRLGQGKFKEKFGERKTFEIMSRHVDRVSEICRKAGVEGIMWSDMWFRAGSPKHDYYDLAAEIPESVSSRIPDNIRLCYWDYYHDGRKFYEDMIARHRQLHGEPVVASGVWTWSLFWHCQRATRLTAGPCIDACRALGCKDLFFTMWGDDGAYCDFESAFAGLAWCAEKAYRGEADENVLEKRYRALFGGASWKAVAALGEAVSPWADRDRIWDDPLMNLDAATMRAAADDEIWMTDRGTKHRDFPALLRRAVSRLSRA
ncbi:MAG: hypothetical protein IJ678_09315, partial [Kiritimatiellae bacterium]|nr:hypothetical protein [Kiritimatiellia bacterium]